MKQTTLAFTLALGLVVPGLAYAADSADNGNTIFERDLAIWSGTGLNSYKAPLPAPKMVCRITKKAHFAYDDIYAHGLAVSAGADQGVEGPLRLALNESRLASNKVCLPSRNKGSQNPTFAYDSIYAHDLADAKGTGLKVKPVIFTYDAIKARDLAEAEAQHAYGAV